ncbi:TPA: hypothetical protein HA219_01240 [Candidatus Woesearchaeota archaeon]|nr:hypothetical protein [Candidatus Woesearchaeota archaeon]HIH39330.1 hypothetical protein [Candidatus Woesearchaeota archaeon]
MMPNEHMLYGFFAALIILFLFPGIGAYGFLMIFLGSVLIDADHYFAYVYLKRDISFSNAFDFFIKMGGEQRRSKKTAREPLMIFHTAEVWLLLLVLSFYSEFFLYVLVGMLIHVLLDVYSLKKSNILYIRPFSFIRYYLRKKR